MLQKCVVRAQCRRNTRPGEVGSTAPVTPADVGRNTMNRTTRRPLSLRGTLAALVLVVALGLGLAACATESTIQLPVGISHPASTGGDARSADHGYIPVGSSVSPFDDHLPAIAKLDPELLAAVQSAATAAVADGFDFVVTSGWRSAAYQQALLDDATITYGSLEEARRWVNTPELSTHVTGDAVDIGFTDANSWLSQHGADYGLCQTYANEMWHFELATEPGGTCPLQRPDAAG
jgi:D-alanyl-D-alanine carboxypeptidase